MIPCCPKFSKNKLCNCSYTYNILYFRLVQHEYDNQEACEDNPQADLVDHIRNEMARKPISVKHENLMSVKVG